MRNLHGRPNVDARGGKNKKVAKKQLQRALSYKFGTSGQKLIKIRGRGEAN